MNREIRRALKRGRVAPPTGFNRAAAFRRELGRNNAVECHDRANAILGLEKSRAATKKKASEK
jgi:hypothetical protein